MKIKKLAAVCKTYKRAYIFEDVRVLEDGTEIVKQWVSTGMSAYPLLNMPRLNKESLLAVFDIPENQWQDWIVQIKPMPKDMNLTEYDEEEYQIEWFFSPIIYNGEPLRCLGTEEDGILFLKESLLQPVDCQDTPEFFERRLPDGFPYIVVKDGIMVQGVVMPYDIISWTERYDKTIHSLEKLLGEVRKAEKSTEGRTYTPRTDVVKRALGGDAT